MSSLRRAASGGIVGGASSLSTAGSIAYVASAGVLGQDPTFARSNPGRYTLYDSTPTTGVTTFTVRAGAANSISSGGFALQNSNGVNRGLWTVDANGSRATFLNLSTVPYHRLDSSGATYGSTSGILWTSGDTNASADLGLVRDAAGRLRVTDGSTGLGQIMIASSTPASASATGAAGTIVWDANYIYVCTAANTWKRVAIATW